MLQSLTVELETNFKERTMNENWCIFRDKLKVIEATCVLKMVISSRTNDPWFTRDVKRLLNRKKRLYRKAAGSNDCEDWRNYKTVFILTEQAILEAELMYFNVTLPSIMKTDPRKFWNIVSPKDKNLVPVLKNATGDTLSLEDCAEEFSQAFAQVFEAELPLSDSLTPS